MARAPQSGKELDALKRLAAARGISATHALRQAIQTELHIQRVADQGKDVLVRAPDGLLEQVVFTQTGIQLNEDVASERQRDAVEAEIRSQLGTRSE